MAFRYINALYVFQVKTESLLEDGRRSTVSDNISSELESLHRNLMLHRSNSSSASAPADSSSGHHNNNNSKVSPLGGRLSEPPALHGRPHLAHHPFLHGNGIHHAAAEHEALQVSTRSCSHHIYRQKVVKQLLTSSPFARL